MVTPVERELKGQLYLAVVTSEENADPLAEARRRVDSGPAGYNALIKTLQHWAKFWSKSYVRIDAYLENLATRATRQAAFRRRIHPSNTVGCGSGTTMP
jgi:hypothetical protein